MTIQCDDIDLCKTRVHYQLEPSKVVSKRQECLKSLKKYKMPGFRPGMAPDWAIKTKFKKELTQIVKQELTSDAYQDILFETKIKPLGQPQIEQAELHNDEFWCSMVILKRPEFTLKQYKEFDLPNPQTSTIEELVQRSLQELRLHNADSVPFEENDFIAMGDKVTMTVECFDQDQKVSDMCHEGILYTVGDTLYPDFDSSLLGMKADELKMFALKLNEKLFTFKVKIHMGLKNHLPALDDNLAKTIGVATFDELLQRVQTYAKAQVETLKNNKLTQQVILRLLADHDIEMPDWLIETEVQFLLSSSGRKIEECSSEQKDEFLTQAKNNLKLTFILEAVKELEPETSFNDQEVISTLAEKLHHQGQDPKKFLDHQQQNGTLRNLIAKLKNDLVLQWITNTCKIIE